MCVTTEKTGIESKRNYTIEFLRFVFCILIINYHFFSHFLRYESCPKYFIRGYMGDEFFFMVCGFFLAKSAAKTVDNPVLWNVRSIVKRIRKVAVPYYLTWCACFVGGHLTSHILGEKSGNLVLDALNSIYELLFLEMFGFNKGYYSNIVGWFFSALLIVTFVLGTLVAKYKNGFSLYVAPLIAFLLYGVLSRYFDYLHDPYSYVPNTFLLKGLVRAFAAVCVGIFLEGIVQNETVQSGIRGLSEKKRKLIWGADVCLWIVLVSYMIYPFASNSAALPIQYDFIVVILMMFALLPVLGFDQSFIKFSTVKRIMCRLGTFSFYAYFGQAIFYSFDRIVYRMNINIVCKAVVTNASVLMISVMLWIISIKLKNMLHMVRKEDTKGFE